MFNTELKERFLNENNISESTQKTYRFILEKASKTEEDLNKDISEMNPYECDQLIYSYSRKSEQIVFVIISCLKTYVDFCIENKVVFDFNYFAQIRGVQDIRKYLDNAANKAKFITYDDIIEAEKFFETAQDFAVVELLFCGVCGEKAKDLLNLKIDDIREDRIILPDREVEISQRTHRIIMEAYNQTENRIPGSGNMPDRYYNISKSEYIFRPLSNRGAQMTYSGMLMRINKIKRLLDNPYITMHNLVYSGQLHLAKEIKVKKGMIDKEDWENINEKFGYNKEYWYVTRTRLELFL